MNIKIRAPKKKDQDKIRDMFLKLTEIIKDDSLMDLISNSGGDGEVTEAERKSAIMKAFVDTFKLCFIHLTNEVDAFLADLANLTEEEYQDGPFDINMEILAQLMEAPEIRNFIGGASRVYNVTQGFGNTFRVLKKQCASTVAKVKESLTS